jgi:hypothetical protein
MFRHRSFKAIYACLIFCTSLMQTTPPLQAAQPRWQEGRQLIAWTINTNAGARSRYVLWLQEQLNTPLTNNIKSNDLQILFPADFNINPNSSEIKLCYLTHKGNSTPAHSQCVEEIQTTNQRKIGQGRDLLWIGFQKSLDPNRSVGLVIDAINPIEIGAHTIEAFLGSGLTLATDSQPLGYWLIRINARDWDD